MFDLYFIKKEGGTLELTMKEKKQENNIIYTVSYMTSP